MSDVSVWQAIFFQLTDSQRTNKEGDLITQLLTGYKPDIKPTIDAETSINVSFRFILYRIEGLVSRGGKGNCNGG